MKKSLDEQLFDACFEGREKAAFAALAAGADVLYRDPESGLTAFHCAASGGLRKLATALAKAGADVKTRSDDGATALFELVEHDDDVDAATFLLDLGVDADAPNKDGWTPLMLACRWDSRWNDMARLLIKRGANVNHIALDDWSPLMLAFHSNSRDGVDTVLLREATLDVNLVTPQYGWTPLLHAAAGTNLEAVRTLLGRGARLDARMKISSRKPHTSRATLAASNVQGAIRAKPEHDGFTPLHWAVVKKRRCQQLLRDAGADTTAKSKSGKTPIALGLPPRAPAAPQKGSTEQSLLLAIAAKPHDDALRLVYSDWLLEQGNPWGEVVQLGVKVAKLGAQAPAAMVKSLAALEKKHAPAFLGKLVPFLRRPKFERGLLSLVVSDAQLFPSVADAIADRAPLASLQVTGLKPKGLAALFAAPLGRFSHVMLEGNRLEDDAIEQFAASPGIEGLKHLKIGRNPFSNRGALALARSPHLSHLVTLDIESTWPEFISTDSLQAIVSSKKLPKLEVLALSCEGPGIAKALMPCTAPLRSLNIYDIETFDDEDAATLVRIKGLKKLESLELGARNNHLGLTAAGQRVLREAIAKVVLM